MTKKIYKTVEEVMADFNKKTMSFFEAHTILCRCFGYLPYKATQLVLSWENNLKKPRKRKLLKADAPMLFDQSNEAGQIWEWLEGKKQ
jgi:hypothetical protein